MSSNNRKKEPRSILKTLLALSLIFLCLLAAKWQYERGIDRHSRNSLIKIRISKQAIPLASIGNSYVDHEWQSISTSGNFSPDRQILLRNRYSEGKYGFEVLTFFTAESGLRFWINRGWVQAGATVTSPPKIPKLNTGHVDITGRLRLDTSLPQGSFFALPASGENLIKQINAQSQFETENFYLDLQFGSDPALTPKVPVELPELSDGPHMAYALQWIFFAGLIGYGRILIRRSS